MLIKTDAEYIRKTLIRRERDAHKGDFGKIMIFAGSEGMAGAAVLCGRAALRTGAGLTRYLLSDESKVIMPVLQTCVPEATCRMFSSETFFPEYSAICAGPGLGTGESAQTVLKNIFEQFSGTLVLDADALNIIACSDVLKEKLSACRACVIMTPHTGEARRLLGRDAEIRSEKQREDTLCELAEKYNAIIVLKGAGTIVGGFDRSGIRSQGNFSSNERISIYKNEIGNPGMATGGSGDVLTGIIGSLAAQGYSPLDAARTGVFIHGAAGDEAAAAFGEMGMIASDITDFIPSALKAYYPLT